MELYPFINRLWYGEGFDYDTPDADYWLVEISGAKTPPFLRRFILTIEYLPRHARDKHRGKLKTKSFLQDSPAASAPTCCATPRCARIRASHATTTAVCLWAARFATVDSTMGIHSALWRTRNSILISIYLMFVPRMSCQMIIGVKTVLSYEKTLQMKCRFLAGCGTSGTISRFMTQVSVVQRSSFPRLPRKKRSFVKTGSGQT
jgi:hypothetical protein